jgi:MFS family permease
VKIRISLAKLLSQSGVGIRYVTFIYLVYQVWHSPLAVGAALGVPSLAQWFLGPLAGLLADKFQRPKIIALMYAFQSSALLGLLIVTDHLD